MNNNFNMDKGHLTFGNKISRKHQLQLARMKKRRHVTEDGDTIINSDSDTIIIKSSTSSSDPEELELYQSRSDSKLNLMKQQLEASDNTGINLAFTISYKMY